MKELNDKQKRFCEEYIKDNNATKAYLKVYKCKEHSANVCAAQLLAKPSIQAYLKKFIDETSKRTQITVDWVINKHKEIVEKGLEEMTVYTKSGECYTKPRDMATANNATRDIGKFLGIYHEDFRNAEAIAEDFKLITRLIKKYLPDQKKYDEFLDEFKRNSRMYQG